MRIGSGDEGRFWQQFNLFHPVIEVTERLYIQILQRYQILFLTIVMMLVLLRVVNYLMFYFLKDEF